MGERKVLNKYFPPDFDPNNVPRRTQPKDKQIKVRVMLPFTCQCKACGEFINRGKKFNSRAEWADERYLGIKIMRFYIKCTNCGQEITFKTDPQNSDYICEHGAVRNFDHHKNSSVRDAILKELAEKDSKGDVMKTLEDRTEASKMEMEIMDALEEQLALNTTNSKHSDEILVIRDKLAEEKEKKDEDDAVAQIKFGVDPNAAPSHQVKRLKSSDAPETSTPSFFDELSSSSASTFSAADSEPQEPATAPTILIAKKKDKKKKKKKDKDKDKSKDHEKNPEVSENPLGNASRPSKRKREDETSKPSGSYED